MKIVSVEPISLLVPITEAIPSPISIPYPEDLTRTIFGAYRTTLVRVRTDDGLEGVGECMVRLAPTATRDIVQALEEVLLGRDPFEIETIWERMYGTMMNRGHWKGFFIEAISGIDIALWDLLGKALGQPVYKLLGAMSNRLWSYASSLRFREWTETLDLAHRFRDEGFNAMKVKIGQNPRQDVETVRRLREALGPEVTLMADANCGYDANTALWVGERIQEYDILWFEEPIAPDDLVGYHNLCQHFTMRIAAGESEFTRYGFRELVAREAVDVIQPNVSRCGGLTEARKIAALASAFHVPCAPHTGSSSAICMAAALHFAASLPNFLIYEYMQTDWSRNEPNPLRRSLILEDPYAEFHDGFLYVPDRPGLGVTLNEDIISRYRVG